MKTTFQPSSKSLSTATTVLALIFLLATRFAALAGFDFGSPTSQTPYDHFMAPVHSVLSTLGTQKATMEQVKKVMLQGRAFHYHITNPFLPSAPETTAQTRSGDCKDKANWLISQLGDSDVRFVIGKTEPNAKVNHAWVMWRNEGRWWLLDCTLRSAPMAADEIPNNRYLPLYSFAKGASYRHASIQTNTGHRGIAQKQSVASNGR